MSRPTQRTARPIVLTLLAVAAALLVAGCGSEGKEIKDVKSCLGDLKLTVEDLPKDTDVESGVFATTDLTKVEDEEFTFALAAHVKSDDAVKQFKDESTDFAKNAGADEKLDFETGTDGRYVWVAGGAKDTEDYADARKCVEP